MGTVSLAGEGESLASCEEDVEGLPVGPSRALTVEEFDRLCHAFLARQNWRPARPRSAGPERAFSTRRRRPKAGGRGGKKVVSAGKPASEGSTGPHAFPAER